MIQILQKQKYLLSDKLLREWPQFKSIYQEDGVIYMDGNIERIKQKYSNNKTASEEEQKENEKVKQQLIDGHTKIVLLPAIIKR